MLSLVVAISSLVIAIVWPFILFKMIGREISAVFNNPAIKAVLGSWGKQGGDKTAIGEIKNKMAKGYIDKNLGLIKIAADKVLGINVDDMLEEYGAENIITAIQQLAPKLGFDLSKGLEGLNIGSTKVKSEYKEGAY